MDDYKKVVDEEVRYDREVIVFLVVAFAILFIVGYLGIAPINTH